MMPRKLGEHKDRKSLFEVFEGPSHPIDSSTSTDGVAACDVIQVAVAVPSALRNMTLCLLGPTSQRTVGIAALGTPAYAPILQLILGIYLDDNPKGFM